MIKSIRLQNFFGFQDCTINLEKGENVLVGINGSGKSNFFKALKLLKEGVAGKKLREHIYQKLGGFSRIFFLGNEKKSFSLSVEIGSVEGNVFLPNVSTIIYELEVSDVFFADYTIEERILYTTTVSDTKILGIVNKSGSVEVTTEGRFFMDTRNKEELLKDTLESFVSQSYSSFGLLGHVYDVFSRVNVYDSFNTGIESAIRRPVVGSLDKRLSDRGDNLPQILNTLSNQSKSSFKKIEEALTKVSPSYLGIDFYQIVSEIELRLEEKGFDKSVSVYNISDGTLRFLCLMAILYNPNRGTVVCIDEPELGLHPDMINTLYRAIEHAAETSQVIISTHSSHLLDYFQLENVRVFEKNEENATVVYQYGVEDFQGWYDSFHPGQMWRAGDIGGKRW